MSFYTYKLKPWIHIDDLDYDTLSYNNSDGAIEILHLCTFKTPIFIGLKMYKNIN